jgi:hypothetical protein
MAVVVGQVGIPSAVRELARELLPRSGELARGMTDHLYATISELAASDDEGLREELFDSAEANVAQVMWLLGRAGSVEEIVVPAKALEFMRSNVRRGIPLPALLRSYRLGHAWLWERWSQALKERIEDSGELTAGQDLSSGFMFAYVDRLSDAVVEEFGTERERMRHDAVQLRRETVRAILAEESVDEALASARLSYELRRHHVALRVTSGASEVGSLAQAVAGAAAALGPGAPLVVASGAARFDAWYGSFEPPVTERLSEFVPPSGVLVSCGSPGEGVAGFRRSHSEALHAARIVSLAADAASAVTRYERVELVSLLASDLPRARAFVATQLGGLASPAEPASRLRKTVLAFLTSGASATRVGRDLHVHQNTVAYRVKRAEELLGRKVTEHPTELTCALTLAATLGPAVLGDDGSGGAGGGHAGSGAASPRSGPSGKAA